LSSLKNRATSRCKSNSSLWRVESLTRVFTSLVQKRSHLPARSSQDYSAGNWHWIYVPFVRLVYSWYNTFRGPVIHRRSLDHATWFCLKSQYAQIIAYLLESHLHRT